MDNLNLKAIFWDMDGTILDSEKLWEIAMIELLNHLGRPITQDFRESTIGSSQARTVKLVCDFAGMEHNEKNIYYVIDWLDNRVIELFSIDIPWMPGAKNLLENLGDYPMVLVTNTNRKLTQHAFKSLDENIFVSSVCGDEVEQPKPAPDPYLKAVNIVGFEPLECLVIEDSVNGSTSAINAGIPTIIVGKGNHFPISPLVKKIDSLDKIDANQLSEIHNSIICTQLN